MTKQECNEFKLALLFFMVQIAFIHCRSVKKDIDKFVCKLKEEIRPHEKFKRDKVAHKYTLLRIKNSDFLIKDLSSHFDTLFDMPKTERMVTMISIRNLDICKYGNMLSTMDRFMFFMQRNNREGHTYPFQEYYGLMVDYIDKACIENFVAVNAKTNKMLDMQDEFNKLVIDHFPEICFASFKEQYFFALQEKLAKFILKVLQNECSDSFDIMKCSETLLQEIEQDFNDAILKGRLYVTLKFKLGSERERMDLTLLKESDRFIGFFDYLTRGNHKELFDQGIKTLANETMPFFNLEANKKMFYEVIKAAYCVSDQLLPNAKKDFKSPHCIFNYQQKICKFLRADKRYMDSFHQFFDKLDTKKIQSNLKEEYGVMTDEIREEIGKKTLTQIFINQKVSEKGLYTLRQILEETKALEMAGGNQQIYIDMGREISKKRLQECAKKISTLSDGHTIEVFTTAEPGYRETNSRPKLRSYRIDKSEATGCGHVKDIDKEQTLTETVISIVNRKELANAQNKICINPRIRHYFEYCSDNLLSLRMISVKVKSGTSYIYIARSIKKDTGKEILSFIYDMPIPETTGNDAVGKPIIRTIEYMLDIPRSLLTDLYDYLQFLLSSTDAMFTIPNLWSVDGYKMVDISNYIENEENFYIDKHMDSIKKAFAKERNECLYIDIKEILRYGTDKSYAANPEVTNFVKTLGITDLEFYKIMHRVILGISDDKSANMNYNTNDKYKHSRDRVAVFFTDFTDGSKLLHICEVKQSTSIESLMMSIKICIKKKIFTGGGTRINGSSLDVLKCLVLIEMLGNIEHNHECCSGYEISRFSDLWQCQIRYNYQTFVEREQIRNDLRYVSLKHPLFKRMQKRQPLHGLYLNFICNVLPYEIKEMVRMSVTKMTSIKMQRSTDKRTCKGIKRSCPSEATMEYNDITYPVYKRRKIE